MAESSLVEVARRVAKLNQRRRSSYGEPVPSEEWEIALFNLESEALKALPETIAEALEAEEKLAETLVGYANMWVAVRHHEVVASAATLAKLLTQIGPENDVDGCFYVEPAGTIRV